MIVLESSYQGKCRSYGEDKKEQDLYLPAVIVRSVGYFDTRYFSRYPRPFTMKIVSLLLNIDIEVTIKAANAKIRTYT